MESDLYEIPLQNLKNYRIAKNGNIWSCYSNMFLKTKICNGYKCFTRTLKRHKDKTCQTESYSIHRLLALVFIENPNNCNIVNHINGIKLDNRIENLEWVTQKENVNKSLKVTSHPRKVLQIDNGKIINTYNTVTEAGNAVGLTRYAISKACLGVNKTSGGFTWKYVDQTNNHTIVDLTDSKIVYDYKNYYIFNNGNVYNSQRKSYLKPIKNASGYCYVTLCKNGKKKNHYIHRIVADHYLVKNDESHQVNHKNKQRDDNRGENLEWVSCSENMKHMHAN